MGEKQKMRLYHYLDARWGLDDIRRRRLKISKIDDMNDPYEWKCAHSDDPESQAAIERTELQSLEKYGVLCFSRSWNNVLMWSHYADRHKGICLGFDVLDERTRRVRYIETPLALDTLAARVRTPVLGDR